MATRRDAREWALQILFELDLNPPDDLEALLAEFWHTRHADLKARTFTERLVKGVRENLDRIDALIRQYAEHWEIERMAILDRNVLRMGLYEMLYCPDIPPVVSINEAIDLAKYFNSSESGRFVNGILDRARKDIPRSARQAGTEQTGE